MQTVEEVAAALRISAEDVVGELKAGKLRGFRVGDQWRITAPALLEFMGEPTDPANQSVSEESGHSMKRGGVLALEKPGLSSVDWAAVTWLSAPSFSYRWPADKGQLVVEQFEGASKAVVLLGGRKHPLLVGFADRPAADMANRRRAVVFLGEDPKLLPVVEFAGSNNFAVNGLMASVIKLPDGTHLKPEDPLPAEYADLPTVVYNSLVVGRYSARSRAVLACKDDLTVMARHALIRARWKGWL